MRLMLTLRYVRELEARLHLQQEHTPAAKRRRLPDPSPSVQAHSSTSDRSIRSLTPQATPYVDTSTHLFLSNSLAGPPSSFQLLDRLPSVADLSSISLEPRRPLTTETGRTRVVLDREILPEKPHMEKWIDYFLTYINSGFPILHGPTLLRQMEIVQADAPDLTPQDVFVVLSASMMVSMLTTVVLAVSCTSQARGQPPSSDLRRKARGE